MDESIDTSEMWFRDVALNYVEGIRSAMDFLARCSHPPNDNAISTDISISEAFASNATGPVGDVVTDKLRTLLNIPRAELDVFSGDPFECHTFMSVFDENIDSKIDDPQIKSIRIIRYTKGAAKTAVKNCILIGGADGYSKARCILRKCFGNDYLVSESITNDLKQSKRVSRPQELLQLADDLEVAETTLAKLGRSSEIDNQRTITDILKRCKPHVGN